MDTRIARLATSVVLVAGVQACRDASVAPGAATAGARVLASVDHYAEHYHFIANGDRASADWGLSDESGRTYGSLYVSRGGSVNDPVVYLSYDITRCDPSDNCVWEYGWGDIPPGDLSGSADGALRLATNTTGLPDFHTSSGGAGVVAVDWKRTGVWEETRSGSFTHRSAAYTERMQGSSSARSAIASGAVLGVPLPSTAYAELGTNHSVSVDFYRVP